WLLQFNDGRLPWWVFDRTKRIPGTAPADYVALARLLWARSGTVAERVPARGVVYERLVEPLIVAALNTDPSEASARLAPAVIGDRLGAGGGVFVRLIAREGLSPPLIDPAFDTLGKLGVPIRFGRGLRALKATARRVEALDFGDDVVRLQDGDAVVVAVPPV